MTGGTGIQVLGRSRARCLHQLAAVLLLASPIPLLSAPAAAVPPFGIGDWVVTGEETIVDGEVILDGNLTVSPGGSLTLVNSSLLLTPGPHEIRVRAGGTLRVLHGSTVGSFDRTENDPTRAGMWVEQGARAEFRNSTFNSIGIIYRWVGSTKIGGVCIYADGAVVDNCTFTGNYIGVTVFGACAVTGCRFGENGWAGALSYGCITSWDRCTFDRNLYGAIAYRGEVRYSRCSFTDNALGAAADGTTVKYTDCEFLRNVRTGLYVSPEQGLNPLPVKSLVHVDDCLFEGNRWGLNGTFYYTDEAGNIWPLEHDLFLTNSDFSDNADSGLQWDRYIPDGVPRRSYSTWTVKGRSEVINNSAHFKGNITVEGVLDVRCSALRIEGDGPGWQDVTVKAGGLLAVTGNSSFVSATYNAFGLFCRPGSAFRLDRSTLMGCGWLTTAPSQAGPFFETGDVALTSSTIGFCPVALVFSGSRGALVEGCSIQGNVSDVWLVSSGVRLQNCSLGTPGSTQSRLSGASLLDSINSTLDRYRIEFEDNRSRVNISWHLDIRAVWSDGRPAPGATIFVTDSTGAAAVNTTLDPRGAASGLVLKELSINLDRADEFTPHRILCTQGPVRNESDIILDQSRRLELRLTDSEPPSLSVASPLPDSHIPSRQVRLSGRAQDNLAIATVMVAVDGSRRHLVYQNAGGERWQVDWDLATELPEGHHTFEAQAIDTSGNRADRAFAFETDYSAPKVLITSPADGLLTNDPELEVVGMAEPQTFVSVNGVAARATGNTFSATCRLSEGQNTVTATATDAAGNSNASSISVRLDTLLPVLDVAFAPDAAAVREPQLSVRGTMEFGAGVTVNGRRVVLGGLADNFTTFVFLSPGPNTVRVEAADAAGNVNSFERAVVLDTTPPAFRVVYPPDGILTRESDLEVLLEAEAGTDMSVGNITRTVPGPAGRMANFSVQVELGEGQNDLRLVCRDTAGNAFAQGRLVTLDTVAPALELPSPADGSATQKDSLYVVGRTDPDAAVTVNGGDLEVGFGGSFSGELRLGAGRNRIVVRATDPAGNVREAALNVTRVPAAGETTVLGSPGPDWRFWGFIAAAATAGWGEGWWLWRRMSRTRHPAPAALSPRIPVKKGVP